MAKKPPKRSVRVPPPSAVGRLERRVTDLEETVERHRKGLLRLAEVADDLRRRVERAEAVPSLAVQQAQAIHQIAKQRAKQEQARVAATASQATAAAITKARERIRELADAGGTVRKLELRERLLDEIPNLSGRGFQAAWKDEAPPEWKTQGRRQAKPSA